MAIHNYKELIVWQKSVELACLIYKITESFPKSEQCGLVSQMRRASISAPSNIAEGRSRVSRKEFSRFLSIAHGSLAELETQLLIAQKLSLINGEGFKKPGDLLSEVKIILGVMIRKLNPVSS